MRACTTLPGNSSISLFGPRQDLGDFDNLQGTKRYKNDAVSADALAVSPFPLFSPERFHVSPEGIFAHLAEVSENQFLAIAGKSFKLSFCFLCESDGPCHDRVVPR